MSVTSRGVRRACQRPNDIVGIQMHNDIRMFHASIGEAMVANRRSRHRATIVVDLRALRLAFAMTLQEAAAMLGEQAELVQTQEQGGVGCDPTFQHECLQKYLAHAATLIEREGAVPIVDKRGMSTLYWFRKGLGLKLTDAAKILDKPAAFVRGLEDRSHPMPDELCIEAWATYVDWAIRRLRRLERVARMHPAKPEQPKPRRPDFTDRQRAEFQKLAYTPQKSEEQNYERALRILRGD